MPMRRLLKLRSGSLKVHLWQVVSLGIPVWLFRQSSGHERCAIVAGCKVEHKGEGDHGIRWLFLRRDLVGSIAADEEDKEPRINT